MATRSVTLRCAQERFREPSPRERRPSAGPSADSGRTGADTRTVRERRELTYSPLPPHEAELYRDAPCAERPETAQGG